MISNIFAKSACAKAEQEEQRQARDAAQESLFNFPIGGEPNQSTSTTESSSDILRQQQQLERQRAQLEAQRLQLQREQLELQRQQLLVQQQQLEQQRRNNLLMLLPMPNFALPPQPLQPYHPIAPTPPSMSSPAMRGQINCYTIGNQTTCY